MFYLSAILRIIDLKNKKQIVSIETICFLFFINPQFGLSVCVCNNTSAFYPAVHTDKYLSPE
jgi:phage pi2 protein 07